MNFKKFSQLGQAFMLPISILPVAGLLLGIGGALSNSNAVAQFPVLDQAWLQAVFTIMSTAGSAVFANLALIFAIGVAVVWQMLIRGLLAYLLGLHTWFIRLLLVDF